MRSGGRLLKLLGLAFCGFVVAVNVAAFIVALVTRHWSHVPQALLFAIAFGVPLFIRIRLPHALRASRTAEPAPPSPGPAVDPGWRRALRLYVPIPRPWFPRDGGGGLTTLRALFLSFVAAIVLFGAVFASVPGLPNGPVVPWIPILGLVAVAALAGARLADKPLDCTSPAQLGLSYRTRFFLRLAFAESVALFAFTITFAGGPAWTYYVGGAFTLARFATNVAPTKTAIQRDQRRLNAQGCNLSLLAALMSPRAA